VSGCVTKRELTEFDTSFGATSNLHNEAVLHPLPRPLLP
jgi:hypothetical protein